MHEDYPKDHPFWCSCRVPFGPINNIKQTFEHPQVSLCSAYFLWQGLGCHAGSSTSSDGRSRCKSPNCCTIMVFTYTCRAASPSWQNKVSRTSGDIQWEEDGGSYATTLALGTYYGGRYLAMWTGLCTDEGCYLGDGGAGIYVGGDRSAQEALDHLTIYSIWQTGSEAGLDLQAIVSCNHHFDCIIGQQMDIWVT